MKDIIKQAIHELLVIKSDKANNRIVVQSDEQDPKKASQETFKNKAALKQANFQWKGDISAWVIDANQFEHAKKTLESINKKEMFIDQLEQLEEFLAASPNITGKSNLMDKITQYITDLTNAVDEASMSAEIRRYLTFFSKFKGRSFNNAMLIYIQRPEARQCMGFRQWEKKMGRAVKKGAKGILIFAPRFSKKKDDDDDSGLDTEVKKGNPSGFLPVYVFDISDTEPIVGWKGADGDDDNSGVQPAVPVLPDWYANQEVTEVTAQLFDIVKEIAIDMGIDVTQNSAIGGENGFSSGDHINLSSSVKSVPQVSTIVHELAHELMHWKKSSIYYQGDEVKADREIVELQAESVSYVVMKHYDLPVTKHPTYIALWKGNKEKIMTNLKSISEVAQFIIHKIDTYQQANQITNKSQEKLALAENKK